MNNLEDVLMELNKFEARRPSAEKTPLTPLLEEYIVHVAKTGATHFPWPKVKPLLRAKIDLVIDEFFGLSPAEELPSVPNVDAFSFPDTREKVFQQLDCFAGVPFTVQRLCELLVSPRRHYKRTDKFMRALEKNMLIVSTVEPRIGNGGAEKRPAEDQPEEAEKKLEMRPPKQVVVNGGKSGSVMSPSKEERLRGVGERKIDEDDADAVVPEAGDGLSKSSEDASDELAEQSGPCDSRDVEMSEDTPSDSAPETTTVKEDGNSSSAAEDDATSQSVAEEKMSEDESSTPSNSTEEKEGGDSSKAASSSDEQGPCDSGDDASKTEAANPSEAALDTSSSSTDDNNSKGEADPKSSSDVEAVKEKEEDAEMSSSSQDASETADDKPTENAPTTNTQPEASAGPCDSVDSSPPSKSETQLSSSSSSNGNEAESKEAEPEKDDASSQSADKKEESAAATTQEDSKESEKSQPSSTE